MKKAGGQLLSLLAVLVFVFCQTGPVWAKLDIPEPTEAFYVGDFAGVLSSATTERIVQENDLLFENTGAQIVVVTVDFLNGVEISDYAAALFNRWEIGSAEKNNGLLLLLAIGEDNYFATQGKGLEDSLSSGVLGDLLAEYLEPDFAVGDYDAGVRKVFDALLDAVKKIEGYQESQAPWIPEEEAEYYQEPEAAGFDFEFLGALVLFVLIVAAATIFGSTRRRRRIWRGGYHVPPPPPPFYPPPRRPPHMWGSQSPRPPGGRFGGPRLGGGPPRGGSPFGGAGRQSSSSPFGGAGRRSSSSSFGSRPSSRGGFSSGGRRGGGGSTRGGGAGRR